MKILSLLLIIIALSACAKKGGGGSGGASTAVQAAAPITKSVTLAWGAAAGTVQGYLVEKSTNGTTFTQIQVVTGGATTSTTVSGLSLGTTYYFRIRAFNQAAVSAYAATATIAL